MLIATVAVGLLPAGCGGGGGKSSSGDRSVPKPKDTLAGFNARLTAAVADVEAGNCKAVSAFNANAGFSLTCNAQAKKAYAGFKITGSAAYGSGAIVQFTDAEVKRAKSPGAPGGGKAVSTGIYTLAIDQKGRYQITGPISPILPAPAIGTTAASFTGPDAAANGFIDAVRRKDCAEFVKISVTPGGLPPALACAQGLKDAYADLTKQLQSEKDAKPFRIGATAPIFFYGLHTGGQYRTLIVLKTAPGAAQPYLAMGTFRGPS